MLKVTFYTIGFSNLILSAFLCGGVNDQFITSEEVRELRKTTIEIEKSLARYREKMRLDREEIIQSNSIDLKSSKAEFKKRDFSPQVIINEKENSDDKVSKKEELSSRIDSPQTSKSTDSVPLHFNKKRKIRGYILPFVGINFAESFVWTTPVRQIKMQQDSGISIGASAGKSWDNLFIEIDLSYLKNEIGGFEGDVALPFIFRDGSADLFNFHLNSGFVLNIGKKAEIRTGGGIGLSKQKIVMDWSGSNEQISNSLLGYQLFSGIQFNASENMLLGIQYEWNFVPEKFSISKRSLHQINLSAGYRF